MIKKCLGCGVKLQDKDDTSCGYVSSMDKDLCTRCFKIKHYNEYKRVSFNNSDYLSNVRVAKESISSLDIGLQLGYFLNISGNR